MGGRGDVSPETRKGDGRGGPEEVRNLASSRKGLCVLKGSEQGVSWRVAAGWMRSERWPGTDLQAEPPGGPLQDLRPYPVCPGDTHHQLSSLKATRRHQSQALAKEVWTAVSGLVGWSGEQQQSPTSPPGLLRAGRPHSTRPSSAPRDPLCL